MTSPCPICNGSGQITFFKGVSRFLLSDEECPECGGTGVAASSHALPPSSQTEPLISRLAEDFNMEQQTVQSILLHLSRQLRQSLEKGEPVVLRGFGSFIKETDKAGCSTIMFKAGKGLNRLLNS